MSTALPEGWRLRRYETLPSTSDLLRRLAAAGEPGGLAVMAAQQTAGRGRDGRPWTGSAGNLYLSALLRPGGPARAAGQWSLLAAVALAGALLPLLPQPGALRLKWPNDLLLDGAKCAGILTEASATPGGDLEWLVLGIGVNLATAPELPDRRTASLARMGVTPPAPEVFAAALLDSISRWSSVMRRDGFDPVRQAWLAHGPVPDSPVTVRGLRGPLEGRFAGLREDGALLLSCEDGIQVVASGEVQG